ncbi:hypothetical protein [Treponema saccharophilum]|uniref:Glycosyl transferase family 39 n=1 Tax=Treponema saccharophilum DSM 2985 TaxID=907348 RepID=H7EI34_9SPIR|nr:hypothetical protein [Treponema saccharophilum]EIC02713.1 glycosyl transferase family 39 [Treponema saccharophilum DSM 2985]BDC96133.1 hypothetical protein TRSA_12320 [Treponema saccharophilum]
MITENAGKIRECICSVLLVFVCFIFYFVWSLHLPMNLSPDEYLRYQIPVWIFEHGRLPVGNEPELINNVWGFSYGFVPYTPSLVSIFFMFLVSFFTNSSEAFFHAARMPNVLFGAGTVLLCLLIGKEFFRRKETKYLFAALVGFLPQFAFLSSYLNNDNFSVFCSAIILLAWIRGIKYTWSIKNCVLLSIGIGLTAISYYNAFGWILCSIFLVFFSIFCNKTLEKKTVIFLRIFFIVFCISFAIAGWFFVRNFIIHEGDIFGLRSCDLCGEQNARFDLKPSNRSTPKNQGLAFDSILFSTAWHKLTIRSFFCVLGYMNIFADDYVYAIYYMFVIMGIIGFVLNARIYLPILSKGLLPMLIACIVIPYALSMYRSYSTDYQPQGRYVMPALLPLQLFVASGYETLSEKTKKIIPLSAAACVLVSYLILFSIVFFTVIYPICWGIYGVSKVTTLPSNPVIARDFSYCIDAEDFSQPNETKISGWAFFENDNCDAYIYANEKYYTTRKVLRSDVKDAFRLKSSRKGFEAIIPEKFLYYKLILVNKSRKENYCKIIHEELASSDNLLNLLHYKFANDNSFPFFIDSEDLSDDTLSLSGWAYNENDDCDVYIGIKDKTFKTEMVHRPDVKEAFGLESDTQGFSAAIPFESDLQSYTLYLVNNSKKEIYKKTISISKSDDLDELFSNAADVE